MEQKFADILTTLQQQNAQLSQTVAQQSEFMNQMRQQSQIEI